MGVLAKLKQRVRIPLYRFQRDGVRFVEKTNGRALICDDMGLGKTAQSISWAAIRDDVVRIVVVCPSTMKWTWQREWEQFAGFSSFVCEGEVPSKEASRGALLKRLHRVRRSIKDPRQLERRQREIRRAHSKRQEKIRGQLSRAKKARILILNYDIIADWTPFLLGWGPDLLILDECHYVSNMTAKRTKACRELSKQVPHVIGLSGTPISGRPAQFFPILQMVRPKEYSSFWKFAFEYCAPVKRRWGGWDFSGSSNLKGLHRRLQGVMIRRMKREVLKDLPTKRRTIIPVEIENREEYDEAEENFLAWLKERKGQGALKKALRAEAVVKMGVLKQLAAEGKLSQAVQWIRDWLEETNEKLVVFAIHKKILKRLRKEFPQSLLIDGSVSNRIRKGQDVSDRQRMVDQFQKGKHRLLLGQLKAAGQGITLTAGANVLKLELGWNPGDHDQAEDRVLRIGQKRDVHIYYMVGKDTIEEKVLAVLQSKNKVVGQILDGHKGATMRLLSMFLRARG